MRVTLVALSLTAVSVLGGASSPVFAQSSKVASGTVTSLSGSSLMVKVGGQDMQFSVDSKTTVEARGGSTKTAQAAASGKAGPHLDELIKAGQSVEVTYTGASGTPHASKVRTIAKAAASTVAPDASMRS